MNAEIESTLEQIVRVGTVSSINTANRTARVKFTHLGDMVSGNLRVMQQYACDVHVEPDNDHAHTDSMDGSTSTIPKHNHPGTYTTYWMPKVGDTVICLYLPVFNGDGVILGVLK
jgi:phage baseplate assembly protein gpV